MMLSEIDMASVVLCADHCLFFLEIIVSLEFQLIDTSSLMGGGRFDESVTQTWLFPTKTSATWWEDESLAPGGALPKYLEETN